jgi:hypothetical protein
MPHKKAGVSAPAFLCLFVMLVLPSMLFRLLVIVFSMLFAFMVAAFLGAVAAAFVLLVISVIPGGIQNLANGGGVVLRDSGSEIPGYDK